MASVRVEGILGRVVVTAEWRDGEVSGDPVLLKGIEQMAGRHRRRFYDDPLAFAALATRALERYSETPPRVTTEGLDEPLERGMTGVSQ